MAAMRLLLLLPFAALAAGEEPAVRLPSASMAKKATADGAAVVVLTGDGRILVDRDGRPGEVSLDQLAEWLRAEGERFDAAEKAKGRSGYTKKAEGTRVSEMPVVLRADEQAPWAHVQWLFEACAGERIYRTEFGVKGAAGEEGRLAAHLPIDRGAPEDSGPRIAVEIFAKKEELGVWGPTQTGVRKPVELAYRVGETETDGMDGVRRYIADAYVAGDTALGEIKTAANVPCGTVVELLNEYHRAGITNVGIGGATAASAKERRAPRLSYPAK